MKILLPLIVATMISTQAAADELLPPRGRSVEQILALKVSDFSTTMTTALGEKELRTAELSELRRKLALPPGEQADLELPGAIWTALLFNAELDRTREVVRAYLPQLTDKSVKFQQHFLYGAHNLMAREAAPMLMRLPMDRLEAREFAMACHTILRGTRGTADERRAKSTMKWWIVGSRRLPSPGPDGALYDPRIQALLDEIEQPRAERVKARPPLVDLLTWPYREGVPVIYSFQRVNRQYPGLAVIRAADGRFHRTADGKIFSLSQLANARTDYPGTITNGNTPQGIFTIVGTGRAQNKWIGPTAYLASQIPVEASVSDFRHRPSSEEWSLDLYNEFLPPSWRGYKPIQEAWLAGTAGRSEMLCHGTTISSDYYRGAPYHPFTPSAGCLVTIEEWDLETGVLTRSDQLTMVQEFTRAGGPRGYLVVVELDGKETPVSLDDVLPDLTAAEASQ